MLLIAVLSCLHLSERPCEDGLYFDEHQVRELVVLCYLLFKGSNLSAQLFNCVFCPAHFVFESAE